MLVDIQRAHPTDVVSNVRQLTLDRELIYQSRAIRASNNTEIFPLDVVVFRYLFDDPLNETAIISL